MWQHLRRKCGQDVARRGVLQENNAEEQTKNISERAAERKFTLQRSSALHLLDAVTLLLTAVEPEQTSSARAGSHAGRVYRIDEHLPVHHHEREVRKYDLLPWARKTKSQGTILLCLGCFRQLLLSAAQCRASSDLFVPSSLELLIPHCTPVFSLFPQLRSRKYP